MLKKYILSLGVAGAFAVAGTAQAAVITLESITPVGSNFSFGYQGTIGPDTGAKAGDRLIIYDFTGYVLGSIFSVSPYLIATTELSTAGLIDPSQSDDPTLFNLIFTYNGPDFNISGGPVVPVDFDGFGAVSIFGNTRIDAFTTFTTKNNPAETAGSTVTTLGITEVPSVPEPASWAMLVIGFGIVGVAARRRKAAVFA